MLLRTESGTVLTAVAEVATVGADETGTLLLSGLGQPASVLMYYFLQRGRSCVLVTDDGEIRGSLATRWTVAGREWTLTPARRPGVEALPEGAAVPQGHAADTSPHARWRSTPPPRLQGVLAS